MTTIPKPVLDLIKRVADKTLWSDEDSWYDDVIKGDKLIPLEHTDVKAAREFLSSEEERNRMIPAVGHRNESFIPHPAAGGVAELFGTYDPDRAAEDYRQRCEGEATLFLAPTVST